MNIYIDIILYQALIDEQTIPHFLDPKRLKYRSKFGYCYGNTKEY
jgi:hypothetical protein